MKRKTLPRMIKDAPHIAEQMRLALFGANKCSLEIIARTFLAMPLAFRWTNAPMEFREQVCEAVQKRLLLEFGEALIKHDGEALRSVASFLEKKPEYTAEDGLRLAIINSKAMLGSETPLTLKGLAEKIGYAGPMEVFRRIVKDIGHPIQKDNTGRPKNPDK